MLDIKDLHVSAEDKPILKGVNLTVNPGEVHAIMGPNGSGKSTLSNLLAGRDGYEITEGSMLFKGDDLSQLEPNERATAGLFLAFQYPVEIPGVATMTFLKAALNAQRKARGEEDISTPDFMRLVRQKAESLNVSQEMLRRALNVGFSGGEKKRIEILQMALLEPGLAVLDETDSGLDIDALKTVAKGVNALRAHDRSMVIITHYQRLLNHITPDIVHVFADGKIVETGGPELAKELESDGYKRFIQTAA